MSSKDIIDSDLPIHEVLAQNPGFPAPAEVIDSLEVLRVRYKSFDLGMHVGQIVVARAVADDVQAFFEHALERHFLIAKVIPASHPNYQWDDEKLMADNVSSGFNFRKIAGRDEISSHGLGLAFDINPPLNPYIRYVDGKEIVKPEGATWNPNITGTLYTEHPLVELMKELGWEWGGDWKKQSGRTGYQHFQKDLA